MRRIRYLKRHWHQLAWTSLLAGYGAAALFALSPLTAKAEGYASNSSYSASSGVNLPSPVQSYGQDEVQAAGGVACRSAVGGGGPYVDAGMVNSHDLYGRQSNTAYARVVVPLGRSPKRVDCSELYSLEIQRLRMELELAKMGMPPGDASTPQGR